MDHTDSAAVPRPAASQLRALAAAVRPDWAPNALEAALADAHTLGMAWPTVLERMGALLADPAATPHDLTADRPRRLRAGTGPTDAYRKARAANPVLARITDDPADDPREAADAHAR